MSICMFVHSLCADWLLGEDVMLPNTFCSETSEDVWVGMGAAVTTSHHKGLNTVKASSCNRL